MNIHERTATTRRLCADFFDTLDEDQLRTLSLCSAWTVKEVLGHLVMPMAGGSGRFFLQLVRHGGSVNRTSEAVAQRLSRRPVDELTALLRDKADQFGPAPGVGPVGQLADGCIHLRDCARPLGLPDDVGIDNWCIVLDWASRGVVGLVPKRRLDGLSMRATDQDWGAGSGAEVSGSSEALALALCGRSTVLDELSGPGASLLRARLRSQAR